MPRRSHPAGIPSLSFPRCPALRPSPFSACPPCPLLLITELSQLPSPCPRRGGLPDPFGSRRDWGWAASWAGGQSRPALTKAWAQVHRHGEGPLKFCPPESRGRGRAAPSPHTSVETACAVRTLGKGEVPAIVPGTAWHGRGEPGVCRHPSRTAAKDTPAPPGRLPLPHTGAPSQAPPGPRGESAGAPRTCPRPRPGGRHRLPPRPQPCPPSLRKLHRGTPPSSCRPRAGSLRSISPNTPHFRPQESRGARRAEHGMGTSGPPSHPPVPRPAALPARHRRTIHPRTCPSIFPAVQTARGGGRGAGAAPLGQPPPRRAGRAGGAAAPCGSAPLRSSPGPAPRGRPRRCPGSGGGRRRGGEGDEASRNCFASRPLCLRQRRVSVAWCRSSAYGHPGTFLCKPFCPRHPRFLAGFLQLL